MPGQALGPRLLVAYAGGEAFSPHAWPLLERLGYRILLAEEYEARAEEAERGGEPLHPSVLLADERRLGEIPEELGAAAPIVVLSGRQGMTGADSRIAGAIQRPAGLHDLYRLLQQVLEDHPRSVPRVATHLRARCLHEDREWGGAILSLSENGCLLRSPEPMALGTRLELRFELPRTGPLAVQADTAYQLVPDLGLVFHAVPTSARDAIGAYVCSALAAS